MKSQSQQTAGKPVYKRILLKISGESLQGGEYSGLSFPVLETIAEEIKEIVQLGVETAIVLGGGNIFRGMSATDRGMDRSQADYMGMLATVINSLALQDALERIGVFTRVLTAIEMKQIAEPYIRRRAVRHLEKGRVVIFAAGTGNTYFTTDTAAALRASEINAEVILKGTKVDGVYDADPMLDYTARRFDTVTYLDVIQKGLKVMDSTAISHCMDHHMPIIVFKILERGNIKRVVLGEKNGTVVTNAITVEKNPKSLS